jgi:ABC-type multidrug transport system ATPase subunit/pSer/pThr/pTyr-binding forkhead associated (FHA) protein
MEREQMPNGAATIRFLNGPLLDTTISIQKATTLLGRSAQNDIVLADSGISRQHAAIRQQNGGWILENLSQSNYVMINQQRIEREQPGILQHNSVVSLGDGIRFIFLVLQPAGIQLSQPSQPIPQQREPRIPNNIPAGISPSGTVLASKNIPGTPILSISSNIHSDVQVHPLNKAVFSIGRDGDNDIVIQEPIVSLRHAQIEREGNTLFFIHPHPARERTLNGIWYQGQHILGDQSFRKQLVSGDIIRIGDEHGTLVTLTYDDGNQQSQEILSELPPILLNSERITIGRVPTNTVVLNHPQVSAYHALLEKTTGGYRVHDNHSTNHVYVNSERISEYLLHTGDEIRIGPYRLIYSGTELRQYDESNHIRIEAMHLTKTGNTNVTLLDDISLVIPPRKFVAIVGGSGAGKSTLMDALNGLRPAHQGKVFYNGVDYYHNLATFSTQLGYVPQDDIVHRDLTVERALYYAARLRLPGDFTREQINWRIDEVLEDVEMTDRRSLLVSKLSGGQRKRVSIALELLANPGIFFLDEPTSGLDPGLDRKMMLLLRRLADRGRTVILVTHATNNINTCDYVCFLVQGGRLAYFGPPNKAKAFFDKTDFAEIYSALEPGKDQPDIPEQAAKRFRASQDYQLYVADPLKQEQMQQAFTAPTPTAPLTTKKARKPRRRGHGWSQFILLSTRNIELLKNDVGNLLILLLQAPVIATMLVLMMRFQVGAGIFDANKVVQCSTQTLTPSGPLALPQAKTQAQIGCQSVLSFLQTDTQGKDFVTHSGGLEQALQKFIVPGSGTDAQKVLFIMAFATVLFGCINGAREIVKEAAIYRRERAVNLGILPYMFSKIIVLGIFCLFQSAILAIAMELGEPFHQGIILPPLAETYITLALTSLSGLMLGLTISAIAPNNDRAISFVPIILIPQVIFSGAIIPLKDWFTQIIATIFPTRWAMAALGSSIGLHADMIGGDRLFGNDYTYHGTLFSIYSQQNAMQRLVVSWAALVATTILLIILIGIFLKRKDIRTG